MKSLEYLEQRAGWVRRETLRLHQRAPGTRVASSLSSVEIFVVLYYGRILRYRSEDVHWEDRDRLVVSKGHGGAIEVESEEGQGTSFIVSIPISNS